VKFVDAATYSAADTARDGRALTIRALQPDDRDALLAAVGRMSAEALYLRFFAPRRGFSDAEVDRYVNVDFVEQVALVALIEESGAPLLVGGARYVRTAPGCAEVAFSVDDGHRGLGLGSVLLRHLARLARAAGLTELEAEVLPDNATMLAVFARSGLPVTQSRRDGVVHVCIALGADGE
jgi:GNAT superfamily N-acetyltransferase